MIGRWCGSSGHRLHPSWRRQRENVDVVAFAVAAVGVVVVVAPAVLQLSIVVVAVGLCPHGSQEILSLCLRVIVWSIDQISVLSSCCCFVVVAVVVVRSVVG